MRLTRFLDKGLWAAAIQVLIALYGLAFMVLVVRRLPEAEFGDYVLIQTIFLVIVLLGDSLAYGPMVRYLHEFTDRPTLVGSSLLLGGAFYASAGALLWIARQPAGALLNSAQFESLAFFIPLLLAAVFIKSFSNQLLRGLYHIHRMFYTDLIYHGVALLLIVWLVQRGELQTTRQILWIQVSAFAASSLLSARLVWPELRAGLQCRMACLSMLMRDGKYYVGSTINSQIYDRADIFMISGFIGPVAVAIYQSAKLFGRIIEMYRQVATLLAFPLFAKLKSDDRQPDLVAVYEKGILFSHLLLIPLGLVLLFFARELFQLVYGDRYNEGVVLLQVLAVAAPLFAWQCLGEGLLFGIGFPKAVFTARTATTVAKVVLNVILIKLVGVIGAVIASVIALLLLSAMITLEVKSKTGFTTAGILRRLTDLKGILRLPPATIDVKVKDR